MSALRAVLVVAGIAAIGFGLWSLRDLDAAQLVSSVVWLAGVVVVHDAVLSPFVLLLGLLGSRLLAPRWRTPVVVAFVVWGAMTLVALPVLSGMGERPDNPSLLDRPYLVAWWVGTATVSVAALAYGWWTGRRVGPTSNRRSG